MRGLLILVAAAAAGGAASDAFAQPPARVFISVNAASQPTKNPFTDRFDFEVNRETGTTEVDYPVSGGLLADGSVAVRLWKGLGAGVAVSRFTRDITATMTSRVPHPFFFERLREVAGEATVTRTEQAVHLQAVYRVALRAPFEVTLFAGPSFIRVEQDVVSAVEYDESFPFDAATFRRAQTASISGSATGINAGADVTWMFSRYVGVGGLVRIARARVDLDFPAGRKTSLDAGGVSAGGGLRIAF